VNMDNQHAHILPYRQRPDVTWPHVKRSQ